LSSGKRIKHLDIRYFYVEDLIDRKVLKVSHCISEEMIANFFMNPIQGKRFKNIRDIILNITPSDEHRSVLVNSLNMNVQRKELGLKEREKKESYAQ